MSVEIPLKLKYRARKTSKRCHTDYMGRSAKRRLHRQLTDTELALHARQPVKVMHLLPNGKRRMVTVHD